MRVRRFPWEGAGATAAALRQWAGASSDVAAGVAAIHRAVLDAGDRDATLLELTARYDATEVPTGALAVDPGEASAALAGLASELREALELAAGNIRAVAEAQLSGRDRVEVELGQGQTVAVREVAVGSAGVYAPGGRASYPSSVLMCAIPARVAGVERLALATPPGPDGRLAPGVLAAAALCGVDEIYALGGAQAIFALAYGSASIAPVDVVVGPGNAWVQEAKRTVFGRVGIDSYAGPSELMVLAGAGTVPEWAGLDLCAQAEHGSESPLLLAAADRDLLERIATATVDAAAARSSVADARLAVVEAPDLESGVELANAYAPEHLQLMGDAGPLAARVRTAGCVLLGDGGATAFGDYVAGSNHVLPTAGAGRFAGPLGPATFRRRISEVRVPPDAAAALAPPLDALARAEGLPVHGESAMARRVGDDGGRR